MDNDDLDKSVDYKDGSRFHSWKQRFITNKGLKIKNRDLENNKDKKFEKGTWLYTLYSQPNEAMARYALVPWE
jgi:hypothetical protein